MAAARDETTRFIEAWMQLRQVIQAANFNRFQRAGLSATQFMTLNVIPAEGMTLSELARRLNLSAATLNETVNSLEERGLVVRARHAGDARKINISATAEGERMQNVASLEFRGLLADVFARMTKVRRAGLLAGLEEMVVLSATRSEPEAATFREDAALPRVRSSQRSRPR